MSSQLQAIDSASTSVPASARNISIKDFYSYLPDGRYLHAPTGQLWVRSSINSALLNPDNPKVSASSWLDLQRSIHQMIWHPNEPRIIEGRYANEGGWEDHPTARAFNLYRPPKHEPGNPSKASFWYAHLEEIYPDDASHIADYLAFKVQNPGVKINHALVFGGAQGIGKDTILQPVRYALGEWNCKDVSPKQILQRFNPWVRCVLAVISEMRDLGEVDRFSFYETMKAYITSPPDVITCEEKYIRQYSVFNVMGVVMTTNHKTGGMHLPPDDRRHYIAWSEHTRDGFSPKYWQAIYRQYEEGGLRDVSAFLRARDLSNFDPKAPPRKTDAWHSIVTADTPVDEVDLHDLLEDLGSPIAVTAEVIAKEAARDMPALHRAFTDDDKVKSIPHKMERAGYQSFHNPNSRDGRWRVNGKRRRVYVKLGQTFEQYVDAIRRLPSIL